MKIIKTLRFKIFTGFILVVVPLMGLLIFINIYSKYIVYDQVSQNYKKLLNQYTKSVDNTLKEFDYFLYMLDFDSDLNGMKVLNIDEYVLSRQRLFNKLSKEIETLHLIDTYFVYSKRNNDLFIVVKKNSVYTKRLDTVKHILKKVNNLEYKKGTVSWNILNSEEDSSFLYRVNNYEGELYAGILIDINNLAVPLKEWELGTEGGIVIVSSNGEPLTNQFFPVNKYTELRKEISLKKNLYQIVKDTVGNKRYLIVDVQSVKADIHYVLIIQYSRLIQSLPYLQTIVYFFPIIGFFALFVYLLYLKRVLFSPFGQLINGMKELESGKANVRIQGDNSSEFSFLVSTFNDMAKQIEKLKIFVYGEKLKVQNAELKYLQMQINPHFYMNSLNIVYNLAAMNDTKSIKKMALYLSNYFRFIMRTDRSTVTIKDEMMHIRNYLDIQSMRYPDDLSYDIQIPEEYEELRIPPLSVQPFVENSVIHGFTKKHGKFQIDVIGQADEDDPLNYLNIIILDNGNGISPEMLEHLNSDYYLEKFEEKHLGIWNVCHRIRMFFGVEARIIFQNRLESGAKVIMRLPLNINRKEEA